MSSNSRRELEAIEKGVDVERNLDKIRADVEKLVEAVRSLVPPPEPTRPERRFKHDHHEWDYKVGYEAHRLRFYVDFLLSMFARGEDRRLLADTENYNLPRPSSESPKVATQWEPTFAFKLSLIFTGEGFRQLRDYAYTQLAFNHSGCRPFLPFKMIWEPWNDENFSWYIGCRGNNNEFTPWGWNMDWTPAIYSNIGSLSHGAICFVCDPIRGSILDFRWINLIFIQICRWATDISPPRDPYCYLSTVMYFLGIFSGQWSPRYERDLFTNMVLHPDALRRENMRLWCLQVHFRCFEAVRSLDKSQGNNTGLRCFREQGQIPSNSGTSAPLYFEEKRISIFAVLSEHYHSPSDGRYGPPSRCSRVYYNVLILGDYIFVPDCIWKFRWSPGLEGTVAFHAALFEVVSLWERKWNDFLDGLDEHMSARLEHTLDPEEIDKWMFDETGFERSKLYVTVLQILRIFSEYIRTVSEDLHSLDPLFLETNYFPMPDMTPEELRMMRSNWESVKEYQRQAENALLDRIAQKAEEVKSLRDGLFNATSLREANRSLKEASRASSMGRYVLVFTVVTILYLPPSFISTVFALDIFKTDPTQGKWEYKVSLVAVSLFTYLLAFASIIAVDWKGFKARSANLLEGFWQAFGPITFIISRGSELARRILERRRATSQGLP